MASFDEVIPPGQEGRVSLSVKTENMSGTFVKSATIHSNDPQHPSYTLKLTATIKSYITVRPSPRVYLNGFTGDVLSQSLTVSTEEPPPFAITNITSTLDDKISYEIKSIPGEKAYELLIKTKESWEGRSVGRITVTTSSRNKPKLDIPVSINFKHELTISPSILFFGTIALTPNLEESLLTKQVQVRKERGGVLAIEKIVPSSDCIKTAIATAVAGKEYTIAVTLNRDTLKKGLIRETLEIYTNDRGKPLFTITLKGNVI